MKKIRLLVLVMIIGLGLSACGGADTYVDTNTNENINIFTVDQVVGLEADLTGEIAIIGIVHEIQDTHRFTIRDVSYDLAHCCPPDFVLVEYGGILPDPGETIAAVGIMERTEQGFVFKVTTFTVGG